MWGFKQCEVNVSEEAGYQLKGRVTVEGRCIGSEIREEGS